METGEFREDLFYRLNVMPIFLPPLRERPDDIPVLATSFLHKFSKEHGKVMTGLDAECLDLMKKYRWPGNIRELKNIIERAFIIESNSIMTKTSLPEHMKLGLMITTEPSSLTAFTKIDTSKSSQEPLDFEIFKEQAEKEFIMSALKANKGKINQTVAQANIPKNTLLRKIRKYSINVKEFTEN
jgi:transcriptional regulator with PAS, ATPase and Fis domain